MAQRHKNPVDLPARYYFDPNELTVLYSKVKMFVRMNQSEANKHWRDNPEEKRLRTLYMDRVSVYQSIADKLEALANVPQRN